MRRFSVTTLIMTLALGPVSAQSGPQAAPAAAARPESTAALGPRAGRSAFVAVHGTALTAANAVIPEARVRIRDARAGRIVSVRNTDASGSFSFDRIDPGSYVVELLGTQDRVLAASDLVTLDAGDTVSVIVRLPFDISPAGALLGRTGGAQALAMIGAAVASGILTLAVTTEVSPEGNR